MIQRCMQAMQLSVIQRALFSKLNSRKQMRSINGGNGESHFTVQLVSKEFEGKVRSFAKIHFEFEIKRQKQMQRHRLVYSALSEEMKTVHALVISAKTPQEAGMDNATDA